MDLRKLKKLIDLVEESGIAEIEVTEGEEKVRITRTIANNQPVYAAMHHAPQPMLAPAPAVAAPGTAAPVAAAPAAGPDLSKALTSPMVGTFYRSSSPGGTPFIDVGSQVKEGDVICIVEAMKILNEIEADHSGTITRVLAENGQAVEYGQALFVIE